MSKIIELSQLAIKDGHTFLKKRFQYSQFAETTGRHFIGIVGPRGVGKTVILKQLANERQNAFYISADTLDADDDLFEITKELVEKYQIKTLLIDEIHFQKNFEEILKKIFDFLSVRVIFTSSVALALVMSSFDLSRRVQLITLPLFSFREYLFFKHNEILSKISLDDIVQKKWDTKHLQYGYEFERYLKGELYPFTLEEADPLPLFQNIIQKVIQRDIPSTARLHTEELAHLEKLVRFVGRSSIDGINYSSISQNVGITKYKAEQYVSLLCKSYILSVILPEGANVLQEPKIVMALPYRLLYGEYPLVVGGLREDFFAQALAAAQIKFKYLKSTRGEKTPDFLVKAPEGDIVIEVGGKGKGREQFKNVVVNKKIRLVHSEDIEGDKRPLFMLGYLV